MAILNQNSLADPVHVLPGIGPKLTQVLKSQGIEIVNDLLSILPKQYQYRKRQKIRELEVNSPALIVVTVIRAQLVGFGKTRRVEIIVKDDTGLIHLVFFNTKEINLQHRFAPNSIVTASGALSVFGNKKQLVHPRTYAGDIASKLEGTWPVYPEVKGIYPALLSQFIQAAITHMNARNFPDIVPLEWQKTHQLLSLKEAYQCIHQPTFQDAQILLQNDQSHPAFKRIAFDELLFLQLNIQKRKKQVISHQSYHISPVSSEKLFATLYSFSPTKAQLRVLDEISSGLASSSPMMKLLQGDVGAGKTAVAACACFLAAKNSLQSAIMVPTEILANQHYASIKAVLEPHGIKVILLTAGLSKKERDPAISELKENTALVAIGTHALISDNVEFKRLGLIVIDEQHRFGVDQRLQLFAKGKKENCIPHMLAMTATPIPRSLALTLYGDFAISILDELPKDRVPVATRILLGDPTQIIYLLSQKLMEKNEQGYIVYPLVEESEKLDLQNAKKAFEELSKKIPQSQIALIHGRMKTVEKDKIMENFSKGNIKLLISTTVIEVGVHVPNATYMMIVHAERFGLSQLHQLRGRVGRGGKKSYCYLVTEKLHPKEDAYRRLSLMEKTNDGFVIATEDLSIRGHGDFFGTRQSGLPLFRFCDLKKHADLIEPARELAIYLVQNDKPHKQFHE